MGADATLEKINRFKLLLQLKNSFQPLPAYLVYLRVQSINSFRFSFTLMVIIIL